MKLDIVSVILDFNDRCGSPTAQITESASKLSWTSAYTLLKKVDTLPQGHASWKVEIFEVEGDLVDPETGKQLTETIELWMRDPVECVQELIGDPRFCKSIHFEPRREYADREGRCRVYRGMETADWWWTVQLKLPEGATVAPVIIASDKTNLSRMSGDKTGWPVYLTIGNIDKEERRRPSSRATLLLGYLPATKLGSCFSKAQQSIAINRVFHRCMSSMLRSLVKAGEEGVEMVCADGYVRRVFPILAAYIADHPEQCMVSGCKENFCPKCSVPPNERGEPGTHPLKKPDAIHTIYRRAWAGLQPPELDNLGLRPVEPFWVDLPHCDIFTAITPDILHQLHKGMFKDHLVSWCTEALGPGGEKEVDRRFKAMPKHAGIRHFKNGISGVSQWTGMEYKNMERVFLGVIAGACDENVTRAARAILDFIHYAHFETQDDSSLHRLHSAWQHYHRFKHAFVDLTIRQHFNFPKAHSMQHYERSIRQSGTADGFNTEQSERLHIDLTKIPYNASNKQDTYLKQMALWLERQEALERFKSYLEWRGIKPRTSHPRAPASATAAATKSADGRKDHNSRRVAKSPAFKKTLRELIDSHGTLQLLPAWYVFLRKVALGHPQRLKHINDILFHNGSWISGYHQFKLDLPIVRQVSAGVLVDTVHASPEHAAAHSGMSATPANMSTVLVLDPDLAPGISSPPFDPSNPLRGLQVARVRAIFNTPSIYNAALLGLQEPLAYVEWFTPLQVYDNPTGMYVVSHSTRQHLRNVSIIPISRIIRTCHLIPVFGKTMNPSWTSENVLDMCTRFYVNPYLRHHDFVLFRYLDPRHTDSLDT
ncbi:uncharacterized protein BXZ73DRAFT_40914 [Epithele typhae]|uniref:uncharacterized protein n=1 Tax=Epithele typhae TaxID=378194 RepID=UPI002008AF05|nr:uncharacterized protein BXZ73DRAFT_40914 [Epithele typhae]KAH9942531.1 hypothetical protein BXZ73DRAFT_40914 [Epithele typhae]